MRSSRAWWTRAPACSPPSWFFPSSATWRTSRYRIIRINKGHSNSYCASFFTAPRYILIFQYYVYIIYFSPNFPILQQCLVLTVLKILNIYSQKWNCAALFPRPFLFWISIFLYCFSELSAQPQERIEGQGTAASRGWLGGSSLHSPPLLQLSQEFT